jgi:hypothetical protein
MWHLNDGFELLMHLMASTELGRRGLLKMTSTSINTLANQIKLRLELQSLALY